MTSHRKPSRLLDVLTRLDWLTRIPLGWATYVALLSLFFALERLS